MLHEKFPQFSVEGDNYPPPPMRQLFAQGLGILKIIIIAMVVLGQNPFPHLNIDTPSIFTWAIENKVSTWYITYFCSIVDPEVSQLILFYLLGFIHSNILKIIIMTSFPVFLDEGKPKVCALFQALVGHLNLP